VGRPFLLLLLLECRTPLLPPPPTSLLLLLRLAGHERGVVEVGWRKKRVTMH